MSKRVGKTESAKAPAEFLFARQLNRGQRWRLRDLVPGPSENLRTAWC